jgi:hypothetical protein
MSALLAMFIGLGIGMFSSKPGDSPVPGTPPTADFSVAANSQLVAAILAEW